MPSKVQNVEFYFVDVMKAPFNFPNPLMYRTDGPDAVILGQQNYKMVGVWKLPVLGRGNGMSILPVAAKARDFAFS